MKKLIAILFVCLTGTIFSQMDSVLLQNGLKSTIKVIAITDNSVNYTVPGDASGTVFSLKKSEIKKLYLNTVLNTSNQGKGSNNSSSGNNYSGTAENPRLENFSRNLIGFNMGQMLFTTASFNYEHILKDGVFGVKIYGGQNVAAKPLLVSYINSGDNTIYYTQTSTFMPVYRKSTFGLELNLFPFYQRKISYYIGPAFQYGTFDAYYQNTQTVTINPPFPQQPYNITQTVKTTIPNAKNISFIINNGVLFRLSPNFFMDWSAGIGIQRNDFGSYGQTVGTRGSVQVTMGYSF